MHGFNFYKFCEFVFCILLWLHVYFFVLKIIYNLNSFSTRRFADEMSGARFWKNVPYCDWSNER